MADKYRYDKKYCKYAFGANKKGELREITRYVGKWKLTRSYVGDYTRQSHKPIIDDSRLFTPF